MNDTLDNELVRKTPSLERQVSELQLQSSQLEKSISVPFADTFHERNEIITSLHEKRVLRSMAYDVLEKIQEETTFFKPFTDLGLRIRQRKDNKNRISKGKPAIVGSHMRYKRKLPSNFKARMKTGGIFGPVVESASQATSVEELVYHLIKPASSGSLPHAIDEDLHESTHLVQYRQQNEELKKSQGRLIQSIGLAGRIPLIEAIAWRTADFPFGSDQFETINGQPTWEHVYHENLSKTKGFDKQEWEAAFSIVDDLIAIGLSTPEVTQLLSQNPKYNPDNNNYPGLQVEVRKKLKERNIPTDDLNKLKIKLHLERKIERLKAVKIVREALVETCLNNKVDISHAFVSSVK